MGTKDPAAQAAATAAFLANIGMATHPSPAGPVVRYRVLGQDGERRMEADGVESILRFSRHAELTDAGLLVLPLRSHGRDHGPSYLFLDCDPPKDLIVREPSPAAVFAVLASMGERVRTADAGVEDTKDDEIATAERSIGNAVAAITAAGGLEFVDEAGGFEAVVAHGCAVDMLTGTASGSKSTAGDGEMTVSVDTGGPT